MFANGSFLKYKKIDHPDSIDFRIIFDELTLQNRGHPLRPWASPARRDFAVWSD